MNYSQWICKLQKPFDGVTQVQTVFKSRFLICQFKKHVNHTLDFHVSLKMCFENVLAPMLEEFYFH